MSVRHLYVHLPFCAHRCGYCDFVTVGRARPHGAYVDALLRELRAGARRLARVETIFLGGGTPTFTALPELAAAPARAAARARADRGGESRDGHARAGRTRCATPASIASRSARRASSRSCCACSSGAHARRRRARVRRLRDAGFDNLSLDLIYGIPGQTPEELDADLDEALALGPEHIIAATSSRRSRVRGSRTPTAPSSSGRPSRWRTTSSASSRPLTGAGYRWYETANFCRDTARERAAQPRLLARPRLSRPRRRRRLDARRRAPPQHAEARAYLAPAGTRPRDRAAGRPDAARASA